LPPPVSQQEAVSGGWLSVIEFDTCTPIGSCLGIAKENGKHQPFHNSCASAKRCGQNSIADMGYFFARPHLTKVNIHRRNKRLQELLHSRCMQFLDAHHANANVLLKALFLFRNAGLSPGCG